MAESDLARKTRTVAETVSGWLVYRDYELVAWLFLRLLGIIYLIAFASLLVQIRGLVGEQGIGREFRHHDDAKSVTTALEAVLAEYDRDGPPLVIGDPNDMDSPESQAAWKRFDEMLAHAASHVGDPQVRHRGTIGGSIGPWLTGYFFDLSGSYREAFIILTVLAIIGLVLIILLRPPKAS